MSKIEISDLVVRDEDGNVDDTATAEKALEVVHQFLTEHESANAEISAAVNAFFDEHKGSYARMEMVVNHTLVALGVNPTSQEWVSRGQEVETWIKSDTRFASAKGRGRGLYRVVDKKVDNQIT